MQYTEEQIIRANQTDIVSFLSAQGEQLGKSGKEYRWKKHDSVTVSGNRWYRHSQGRGAKAGTVPAPPRPLTSDYQRKRKIMIESSDI